MVQIDQLTYNVVRNGILGYYPIWDHFWSGTETPPGEVMGHIREVWNATPDIASQNRVRMDPSIWYPQGIPLGNHQIQVFGVSRDPRSGTPDMVYDMPQHTIPQLLLHTTWVQCLYH